MRLSKERNTLQLSFSKVDQSEKISCYELSLLSLFTTARGEYFGKVWCQNVSLYPMGGHSEIFRSLGPTGAEIQPFKTSHHHKNAHI